MNRRREKHFRSAFVSRPRVPMLDKQYWGLDPLFTNHLKLFICTIKKLERLEEYEGTHLKCCLVEQLIKIDLDLFLLGSHVVQFAQIYGVIVAVERNYAMDTYIGRSS